MIRLAVGGSQGRMGQRVKALAEQDQRFELTAEFDKDHHFGEPGFHVLVDFSTPDGACELLSVCKKENAALVTGTTGFTPEQQQHIAEVAGHIPILKAANFSIGVNFLLGILPQVVRELGSNFDIEIVETHHTRKVDAPSGTALALLETILEAVDDDRADQVIYGREGNTGPKSRRQIGVHSVRSGDIVGTHRIIFGGTGESLTITHEAHSRDTFAQGAIEAAAWIVGKKPGLYSMKDLLNDRND